MDNKIIIKLIKTYGGYYVYDRSTNSLTSISMQEYDELKKVYENILDANQSAVIRRYKDYGLFKPIVIKEILHPFTRVIEHKLNNCVSQITLQVTQQCNLRCGYCAYSGIYSDNRTHSKKRMHYETAISAIDFLIRHSRDLSSIHIAFYGGEPLLEFGLIQACVKYAKNNISGKEVTFGMTTNGTLLNDKVMDFLVNNKFSIGISLDGPKETHNKNRCFENGDGSFDIVMNNIKKLLYRYPSFSDKVQFLTVINPKMDLLCALEYFSTEDIFSDTSIMYNKMDDKGLKENISYKLEYRLIVNYEYLKMLMYYTGKLPKKSVSGLMLQSQSQYNRMYKHLNRHTTISEITHPGGPCEAGVQRLFVDVSGRFFPCERVDETAACFNIGNLEKGYDLEKIIALINNGKVTEEECKQCWNIQNCSICTGTVDLGNKKILCSENKLKRCDKERRRVFDDLYEMCVLCEMGYSPLEMGD